MQIHSGINVYFGHHFFPCAVEISFLHTKGCGNTLFFREHGHLMDRVDGINPSHTRVIFKFMLIVNISLGEQPTIFKSKIIFHVQSTKIILVPPKAKYFFCIALPIEIAFPLSLRRQRKSFNYRQIAIIQVEEKMKQKKIYREQQRNGKIGQIFFYILGSFIFFSLNIFCFRRKRCTHHQQFCIIFYPIYFENIFV